jgi:hypothetical protein
MSAVVSRGARAAPTPFMATGAVQPRQPGGAALQYRPAPPDLTPSALEEDQWAGPINQMYAAVLEALQAGREQPDEQQPAIPAAFMEAMELLSRLPAQISAPSPVIEPDGTVAWEWYGAGRTLVLALDGRRLVQYSAIIYGKKAWGEVPLDWQLPDTILELLSNFPDTHAPTRAVA